MRQGALLEDCNQEHRSISVMTINRNIEFIFRRLPSRVLHRVPGACARGFSHISSPITDKNKNQIRNIFELTTHKEKPMETYINKNEEPRQSTPQNNRSIKNAGYIYSDENNNLCGGLRVHPEFAALIHLLTHEEQRILEKDILDKGCLDSLKTWHGFIIDGHHRYGICQKHDLPVKRSPKIPYLRSKLRSIAGNFPFGTTCFRLFHSKLWGI